MSLRTWERISIPLALIMLIGVGVLFFDIKDDDTANAATVAVFAACILPMAVWAIVYMYHSFRPRGWHE